MAAMGLLLITLAVWMAIKIEENFPDIDLKILLYAIALSRLGAITLVIGFAFSYLK